MKIERIRITDLTVYDGNTKIHTEAQLEQIAESIRRYGFNDPVGGVGRKQHNRRGAW